MRFFLLMLVCLPLLSWAQTDATAAAASVERRAASAQESASFEAFYRQRAGAAPWPRAALEASRKAGVRSWTVTAMVELAPTRGLGALCRMSRLHFNYAPAAKKDGRWSDGAPAEQFAWINAAAGCPRPAQPVRLLQHLPDTDILALLGQQAALLARARLLLAGSTACAELRAYNFTLAGLDIGAPAAGLEELPGLLFQSDHQRSAYVWVKRRGDELTAWNVSCPTP
jgi:hypothetical protein